jgi:hypothetical protein
MVNLEMSSIHNTAAVLIKRRFADPSRVAEP